MPSNLLRTTLVCLSIVFTIPRHVVYTKSTVRVQRIDTINITLPIRLPFIYMHLCSSDYNVQRVN